MSRWSRKPKEQALVATEAAPQLPPCDNPEVIRQWKDSKRSQRTRDAYQKDADRFLAFVGQPPLNYVTLGDLQRYRDEALRGLKASSIARRLSAIKSLLTFACKLFPPFFPVNVGAALQLQRGKDDLAERILPEAFVLEMLNQQRYQATADPYRERNAVLLRLLYKTAIRREELCRLSWGDVQPREEGKGQITVYGKGDKTRAILLDASLYQALTALRNGVADEAPVFASRQHNRQGEKRLCPDQVYRIVRRAAARVDKDKKVSPHWLRHAHASHALDNGAPITLVRDTLGHSNLTTTSRYSHARPNASSGQYLKG